MALGIGKQDLRSAVLTLRGGAAVLFVAAFLSVLVVPGAGRVALPVAFTLVGILCWQRGQPTRRELDQEISESLHYWMTSADEDGEATPMRTAFRNYFEGSKIIDQDPVEGQRLLGLAIDDFDEFLAEPQLVMGSEKMSPSGLSATVSLHRGKSSFHMALAQCDPQAQQSRLRGILSDLEGFETDYQEWQTLLMSAIALRVEVRLKLGELDEAEADQELLDIHGEGADPDPEISATRQILGDAMWEAATFETNEEAASELRFRALIHYDGWLRQVGDDYSPAHLLVASRNDEIKESVRVIALLSDVIDDHRFAQMVGNRGLLDANRLLARAHLREKQFDRALRYYSVLMSVASDENPYLRDGDVLAEVALAEAETKKD